MPEEEQKQSKGHSAVECVEKAAILKEVVSFIGKAHQECDI